ncbi:MAG: FixH family protein [Asticcacaulis sp.]
MTATLPVKPEDMTPEQRAQYDKKRGRFVPWIIVAFYISFIVPLICFAVIAFRNAPSEVTSSAYEKGLNYNLTLSAQAAQDALGWKSTATFDKGELKVILTDAEGAVIDGASVRAWFVHPANKKLDREVTLHPVGPGTYAGTPELGARAGYTVHITAAARDREYQTVLFAGE